MSQQGFALSGWPNSSGATVKQSTSHLEFEIPYPLRDRRLADVQLFSRSGEAACLSYGREEAQEVKIESHNHSL
ncbi:hypothetical protein ASG63_21920 [Methylobacterium sp. Leaf94]|nr:hypothetical protein ASG63_21920 [Methylobacterium sp. Leaf94]